MERPKTMALNFRVTLESLGEAFKKLWPGPQILYSCFSLGPRYSYFQEIPLVIPLYNQIEYQ